MTNSLGGKQITITSFRESPIKVGVEYDDWYESAYCRRLKSIGDYRVWDITIVDKGYHWDGSIAASFIQYKADNQVIDFVVDDPELAQITTTVRIMRCDIDVPTGVDSAKMIRYISLTLQEAVI